MNSIVPQHINQETLKSYYLYFNENGDKSSELLDILMNSLLEFVFGIRYRNIQNPKEHQNFLMLVKNYIKSQKLEIQKEKVTLEKLYFMHY